MDQEVEIRRGELAALIGEANRKGINTEYAGVSMQVLSAFQNAARHDRAHVERVRSIFQTFGYYSKTDPAAADKLPAEELQACLKVAGHAMTELRQQLGGSISLGAPPDFSEGAMSMGPGYYRLDGRIVFPSSLVWMPRENGFMQAFGRMGGGYYQLSNLRDAETLGRGVLARNVASAGQQREQNVAPFSIFLGHSPAGWMKSQHPEITEGSRNFTQYDIDSPLIRGWLETLFAEMLPEWSRACGDQPRMHLLANEPHFATQRRGWLAKNGVSEHTMRKYRRWIAAKYRTVEAVNDVYGTSYAELDDVDIEMPVDPRLRGGPVWFDWCRFNMDRVNDWFRFLKEQVQKHDPARSPVTIKMLGHTLSNPMRDHGMDIEYLTKLQDIPGADLRAIPQGATIYGRHEEGLDPETGWVSRYSYDWVDQSMMLDFTKSLCPDKVFYDSEWHGLGAVGWRHYDLDRDYVRSALWLAFSHGMGAIKPWLWGRNADGSLKAGADHIGELSTQPVALDAFGRTLKELNAHAGHVVAAVPGTRRFLLYYCEEAAIQSADYTGHLESVYEALKLLNLPVGFTTPSEMDRLNPVTQTLVVPPTAFIADESLGKLQAFQRSGGRVVLIGAEESFQKSELGAERGGEAGIKALASIPVEGVLPMAVALDAVLNPLKPALPMDVEIMDSRGVKAFGVIVSQSVHSRSGEISVVLNNVSKEPRVISLKLPEGQSGPLIDVITSRPAPNRLVMNPCDVRLLKVR